MVGFLFVGQGQTELRQMTPLLSRRRSSRDLQTTVYLWRFIVKSRLLAVLLVALFVRFGLGQEAVPAPRTLDEMPGYAQMNSVREQLGKLIKDAGIQDIEWTEDGSALIFERQGERVKMEVATLKTAPTEEHGKSNAARTQQAYAMQWDAQVGRAKQRTIEKSPDGNWEAVYDNFNVILKPTEKGKAAGLNQGEDIQVTTDGAERLRYGTCCWVYGEELYQSRAMWWSPDSKKLVFYKIDEDGMRDYYLTTGNTSDYTEINAVRYPIAGAPNPKISLLVYDLDSRQTTTLNIPGDERQYLYRIDFIPGGDELMVHRTNRQQNVLDLLAIDINTGKIRTMVEEVQSTWQDNSPTIEFLRDHRRFIWETEKTGWKQFEMRSVDGQLVNPLSPPEAYPCEQIVQLDEDAGYLYYTAYSDSNPLNQELHRVKLDGTDHRQLTDKPFNYTAFYIAPDHKHFVARYESIDTPPAYALYDDHGKELAVLGKGDLSEAVAAGFTPPELFKFKADDGTTDIYGYLFRPMHFDPNKKYPLVVQVYGGPASRDVTNRFFARTSPDRPASIDQRQAMCEFGFLVAVVGNRGTIGRGKAFESATYKNLGTEDLQDQADGVKYLRQRDYVDGNRVGIYGHSYGGFMAASAILRHPDVFQVAVSGSPVTDWRNYDTIYTERYMQTPQENSEGYANGDCCKYAGNLKGKLLLVHGLVDDNVHPTNTWKLSDALHKANKRFDMMIYPDFAHGVGSTYPQLTMEYLINNLKPEPLEAPGAETK